MKAAVTNLLDETVDWHAAERRELLRTINEETDRLTRFVSRLLDLSRIEGHAVQSLRDWHDIEDILSGVVERLDPRADQILLRVPDGLPPIYLDYLMVEQISSNLIENALKYSPPSGRVEVDAHVRDGQLTIAIADRGTGIPPSEATRIFEKFYRISDHAAGSPGTGLGLAIARGLARVHAGEVRYNPRPGGGSIFTLSLPVGGQEQEPRSA
jgi:two-component system sensor histidine kinase KdpD